ncbi:MAG: hypothetical protein V3574_04255 [Candidatus Moraniibacteriota bacterium]
MEKYGWVFIIFIAIIIYTTGRSNGSENGYNDGYRDGYSDSENEFSDKLEEAENCINLYDQQLYDIESQINSISSDLEFSLDGNYYDLNYSVDSAYSGLNSIWFDSPCR